MTSSKLTRRTFIASSAALAASCAVVSKGPAIRTTRLSPNEQLNIASIGCGGMGSGDLNEFSRLCNVAALCDVDEDRSAGARNSWPNAPFFHDFREMLDKEHKNIDAVHISTPDHTHAVAALACMQLGKHVFVQKPLAQTIYEARKLTEAARYYRVATHMGNQGHQGEGVRRLREWVLANRIGPIREVHCWTDRPWWPQNVGRPEEVKEVPKTLNWDLWLGPAQWRPYHDIYMPFNWRGWVDFGCGALGDMGCHIMDPPYTALGLGYPSAVEAEFEGGNDETFPAKSKVKFEFPARDHLPPVTLYWYDGGWPVPHPEGVDEGEKLGDGKNGSYMVGDWGVVTAGEYGGSPRLVPYQKPSVERTIPNSIGHYQEFVEACKTGVPAGGNFDYAGPFTETVLLGNLALRTGKRIEYDGPRMKVTNNVPEAEALIKREYRKGWEI